MVYLYHARNGSYVGSFGEAIIESAQEITASKDGRVMVLDSDQSCHLFNVDGLHLANFSVNIQGDRYYRIACHPVGEHVVVAGEEREAHLLIVAIYTVNGDIERKIQLNETLNHTFYLFLNCFSTRVSVDQKYVCGRRLYACINTRKLKGLDSREITSIIARDQNSDLHGTSIQ